MWTTDGLINESDVEQKFLYQLLIEPQPLGLGLPHSVIQTKANIRRFNIGKGAEQKLYFPDYVVVTLGFPLVIVEAKHPNESIEDGYREARLYANELNGLYPHGVAPTKFVVACNGVDFWYGNADQQEPLGKAKCSEFASYSHHLSTLVDLISWNKLQNIASEMAISMKTNDLFKPRRLLGGIGKQNEEIAHNAFGATLTASISSIFNPNTLSDRAFIAKNGYISSRRRENYIEPIDRVIRAARGPSESSATELADSENPKEILIKLKNQKELEHKVLLLIGSVGSGKSTFVDHLSEVALPQELMSTTVWCRINMNVAPVSAVEIYPWLRQEIIQKCIDSCPGEDFDDLEIMRKVFSVEINKFNKGVGKLYEAKHQTYNPKLAEYIQSLFSDQQIVANAHVRYTCAEKGKFLIIVLDNCDKKTRDEQLLMFQAAQWLQNTFKCLVILPLRDETYDNHRNEPPLDTALKDLVFRIEPPLFQHVLISRVQLAMKHISSSGNEKLRFTLPNGMTVEYPRSEQAYYLTSILKSLFEHDRFIRRMITGLSGRNIRRALEIFLEFCNSGHIGEDAIFKMRTSEGNYSLPIYQVATVLLRMNRRYYDSDFSYVKNLFSANKDDTLPGYYCRYMMLKILRLEFNQPGVSGLKGYIRKGDVKSKLIPYGLSPNILDREFNYLLLSQCIIAEHLRTDSIDDADLIRLGPAGFVHLELLNNVNYLAALAEDTFFPDKLQAERIAERIRNQERHLSIKTIIENASETVDFLNQIKSSLFPPNGSFMQDDLINNISNIDEANDALTRIKKSFSEDPWVDSEKRLIRGSTWNATVCNCLEYGFLVEFDDGLRGLVQNRNSNGLIPSSGDRVKVKINWVDSGKQRISLTLIDIVAEDAGDWVEGPSIPR